MEVVLLLSAERDLQEAYNWVEEHRRGREQFFLQDVELRLEHLDRLYARTFGQHTLIPRPTAGLSGDEAKIHEFRKRTRRP